MNEYVGAEVYFHASFTWALRRCEWSASGPASLLSGNKPFVYTEWEVWCAQEAVRSKALYKRKICCPTLSKTMINNKRGAHGNRDSDQAAGWI